MVYAWYGCKKLEQLHEPINKNEQVINQFFKLPADAGPALKRIAAEISKRNNNSEFISSFAAINGFPVWNKLIVKPRKSSVAVFNNNLINNTAGTDSVWYIPLVLQDSLFVNGFIEAIITNNDSLYLSYKLAQDYNSYNFNSITEAGAASGFAMLIMHLDMQVFGYKKFKITDRRLFTTDTLHSGAYRLIFEDAPSQGYNVIANSNTTGCIYVTVLGYYCGDTNYAGCNPNCDALTAPSGICSFGRCWVTSSTYTTCSFDTGDGSGGGGSGGSPGDGTPPSHGTGGGGISHPYPCPNNPSQNCPPPRGPIGWEPLEDIPFDPCQVLKAKNNDTAYTNRINILKTNTSLTVETGFGETKAGTYNALVPGPATGNTDNLHAPIDSTTKGFGHTHLNDYTVTVVDGAFDAREDTKTPIRIFSPADVNQLMLLINQNRNSGDYAQYYITMVASTGTYTLKFTGINADIRFGYNTEEWRNHFKKTFTELVPKKKRNNSDVLELFFLTYLKEYMQIKGISLFKSNNDGSIKQIILNTSGQVEIITCP